MDGNEQGLLGSPSRFRNQMSGQVLDTGLDLDLDLDLGREILGTFFSRLIGKRAHFGIWASPDGLPSTTHGSPSVMVRDDDMQLATGAVVGSGPPSYTGTNKNNTMANRLP
ncbi:uncharacterized protein PG998_007356 [Apiospora kogelbergensis]|uniref:uncharacterized protein n=1 Tax=Apiospora kogelbergensis TaxID=1337665 RepID=UPI0031312638